MSGIASFCFAAYEAFKNKKIESRVFFAIGAFFLVLAFDQAWQDQYTSAEWRGGEISRLTASMQSKDAEIAQLRNEVMQKDRPVVLQYTSDPEIAKLMKRQEQEIANMKSSQEKGPSGIERSPEVFIGEGENSTCTPHAEWNHDNRRTQETTRGVPSGRYTMDE